MFWFFLINRSRNLKNWRRRRRWLERKWTLDSSMAYWTRTQGYLIHVVYKQCRFKTNGLPTSRVRAPQPEAQSPRSGSKAATGDTIIIINIPQPTVAAVRKVLLGTRSQPAPSPTTGRKINRNKHDPLKCVRLGSEGRWHRNSNIHTRRHSNPPQASIPNHEILSTQTPI